MLFSNKIIKIDVLDKNGKVAVTAEKNFIFPKNLSSNEDSIVIIKGRDLPDIEHGEIVSLVATTKAGDRLKYVGAVSVSMETQLNIKLFKNEQMEVLEERRRYFKIKVKEKGRALFFVRGEDTVRFDEPIPIEIKDINIGGIYMSCDYLFDVDDAVCVEVDLFIDYRLNAMARILRAIRKDGEPNGYGCEFQGLTAAQEDYIGRYIYAAQSAMRQKNMAKDEEEED